ncbi:DUF1566 domain-containing protein [Myxococcota bacterium]|nr:DUF1566 domain-containing protein [Myxococcota bacterium]
MPYAIVDTNQTSCYGETLAMGCVEPAVPFGGQDAQYLGYQPGYTDNSDGTVSDAVTGLMWIKSPDMDGDGVIDASDKLTWSEIQAYPETLNAQGFAGYSDWRLPTIKELYSLILFSGTDPSSGDESNLIPFIDTDYFDFAYGDASAGERTIDSQYASSNIYVGPTTVEDLLFGVNFADGRIKGYGLTMNNQEKTFLLILVRGNTSYGVNDYVDNGDGTVSDRATGLMWAQDDSGEGMIWEDALAYAQQMNAVEHLGYSDWRVPNIKELQSIIDYTRSPESSDSPALDPVFNATSFINELGEEDWPFVWSSTTHVGSNGSAAAASYVAFGKALGYMNGNWIDVHGAGAQRSDPKNGDPADYPTGFGPQGDAIRIFNYVRLVRGGATSDDSVLAPQTCGNGECDAGETLAICPEDCQSPSVCGDSVCAADETTVTCPADCTVEGPVSCETQADCDAPGGCPDELTEGCTCSDTPDGSKLCVPNCNTAEDCPPGPGGATMTCNPEGLCVPQ